MKGVLFGTILNGVFAGLGVSYNSVKLDQKLNGTEFSSVFVGPTLVAMGEAGGPGARVHETKNTLAPQAELGYLHRFSESSWFLGCKAVYQYLGVTFTENDLEFERNRDVVTGSSDLFVGHLFVSSSQTQVNHELSFLSMMGYFFNQSSVYLGGGPVVFQAEQKLYGVTGVTSVNGVVPEVIGSRANLAASEWVWGGVAQLGLIYPFTSRWFVDVNYSYAVTPNTTHHDSTLFSNSSVVAGTVYSTQGIATVNTKHRIAAQSFTVTMSKVF